MSIRNDSIHARDYLTKLVTSSQLHRLKKIFHIGILDFQLPESLIREILQAQLLWSSQRQLNKISQYNLADKMKKEKLQNSIIRWLLNCVNNTAKECLLMKECFRMLNLTGWIQQSNWLVLAYLTFYQWLRTRKHQVSKPIQEQTEFSGMKTTA